MNQMILKHEFKINDFAVGIHKKPLEFDSNAKSLNSLYLFNLEI